MGKINAEKQRAYRERLKARLGEKFLKKRERKSEESTYAGIFIE